MFQGKQKLPKFGHSIHNSANVGGEIKAHPGHKRPKERISTLNRDSSQFRVRPMTGDQAVSTTFPPRRRYGGVFTPSTRADRGQGLFAIVPHHSPPFGLIKTLRSSRKRGYHIEVIRHVNPAVSDPPKRFPYVSAP